MQFADNRTGLDGHSVQYVVPTEKLNVLETISGSSEQFSTTDMLQTRPESVRPSSSNRKLAQFVRKGLITRQDHSEYQNQYHPTPFSLQYIHQL